MSPPEPPFTAKRWATFGVALVTLSVLSGCSQSEYEQCAERATDAWGDRMSAYIDAGGSNSVTGYYLDLESSIISSCGIAPD